MCQKTHKTAEYYYSLSVLLLTPSAQTVSTQRTTFSNMPYFYHCKYTHIEVHNGANRSNNLTFFLSFSAWRGLDTSSTQNCHSVSVPLSPSNVEQNKPSHQPAPCDTPNAIGTRTKSFKRNYRGWWGQKNPGGWWVVMAGDRVCGVLRQMESGSFPSDRPAAVFPLLSPFSFILLPDWLPLPFTKHPLFTSVRFSLTSNDKPSVESHFRLTLPLCSFVLLCPGTFPPLLGGSMFLASKQTESGIEYTMPNSK